MESIELPEHVREFLSRPNPAVMATLAKDGRPVSVATWYLFDGRDVLLTLDAQRVRLEHLRRDPRVALTVLGDGDWYSHVSLQLHVEQIATDEGLAGADRISRHYTGHEYGNRERPRVDVRLSVRGWHGWGAQRD